MGMNTLITMDTISAQLTTATQLMIIMMTHVKMTSAMVDTLMNTGMDTDMAMDMDTRKRRKKMFLRGKRRPWMLIPTLPPLVEVGVQKLL
jgi:hypothetical protein